MNHNLELLKNTCILGVGRVLPRLLSLIALPLLTTYLTVSEYGKYDLLISLSGLLLPLLTMQIQQAIFRNLLGCQNQDERISQTTSAIIFLIFLNALLLLLVLFFPSPKTLITIFICGISLESFYLLLGQIARGTGGNWQYSMSSIIYSLVNLIGIFFFVEKLRLGIKGVFAGIFLGYLSACLFLGFVIPIKKYFSVHFFSLKNLKRLLKFSLPIVPSAIFLWVVNLSDRLIITSFLGTAMNGIYAIAYKIPQMYVIAFDVFNLAWTETASKVYECGNSEHYYSAFFQQLFDFLIGVMMCMLTVFPLVFKILINNQYNEAYNQVPILFIGVFFSSLVSFYGGLYIALNETKNVGVSSLVGALINIVVNLLMVRKFGLYAASVSSAVSFLIILLYRANDIHNKIRIEYHRRKITQGVVILILGCALTYVKRAETFILCGIITVIFNWLRNRYLILYLLNSFRKNSD